MLPLGADSVIFFDSDWNPAMDAQAQDRAHRIGQTRDVHIYRLITEHTIEENIFLKAQQKKNLDIMVMDQGKFDASHQLNEKLTSQEAEGDEMKDVYTKGGLRSILGVEDDSLEDSQALNMEGGTQDDSGLSKEQMETAMASLEDEDDVRALRGAQKEAAEELKEFDENTEIKTESDAEDDEEEGDGDTDGTKKNQKKVTEEKSAEETADSKNEEKELEKEFAAWQTTVGFDAAAIESSLSPMERYGLLFRENIDQDFAHRHDHSGHGNAITAWLPYYAHAGRLCGRNWKNAPRHQHRTLSGETRHPAECRARDCWAVRAE
jgi:hypothetical protein